MNNITKTSACCFTGHRPSKLPWGNNEKDPRCIELKQRLYDTLNAVYEYGIRHFICGMAIGCDFYFCEAVLKLREEKHGVTLEAAIPWEGQSEGWDSVLRDRYYRLVSDCDYETLVQSVYTPDCMLRRNRYMVDNSGFLIAVYNGVPGGTFQTINYAKNRNIQIIEIPL